VAISVAAALRATGDRAMEKLLSQLVEKLKKAFGERLVSVILYGSAATGEHHPRFSDLNILCVLNEVGTRELADSEDIFQWWRSQGSPSPLLLSEREFFTSTDSFAIEFHDIQRQHRVLCGRDLAANLVVDDSFYRAQVEHDLRAKLLRLRQKAAGVLSEDDRLRRLLVDSLSTFCVLFRHALILEGSDPPATKRDIIARASERFGLDRTPFDRLLDIREERLKPRDIQPADLLGGYLQGISTVIEAVDRMEK
jgi:hypothetical protein